MSSKFYGRLVEGGGNHSKTHRSKLGYAMLKQCGWEEGKGLGVNADGMVECVQIKKRPANLGLGAEKMSANSSQWTNWWDDMYNSVVAKINPICVDIASIQHNVSASSDDDTSDDDTSDDDTSEDEGLVSCSGSGINSHLVSKSSATVTTETMTYGVNISNDCTNLNDSSCRTADTTMGFRTNTRGLQKGKLERVRQLEMTTFNLSEPEVRVKKRLKTCVPDKISFAEYNCNAKDPSEKTLNKMSRKDVNIETALVRVVDVKKGKREHKDENVVDVKKGKREHKDENVVDACFGPLQVENYIDDTQRCSGLPGTSDKSSKRNEFLNTDEISEKAKKKKRKKTKLNE